MKHVERRHFFVRECVERHKIRVPYVKSTDNLADFFTKSKSGDEFIRMRDAIMNVPHALREMPSAPDDGHGGVLKGAAPATDRRTLARGG